jgi:hypothetical protein
LGEARSASPMRRYYPILGISPKATPEEIREAWLFSLKAFHPDKFARSSARQRAIAEARTKAINEAYEVLSDPISRSVYDRDYAQQVARRHASRPASAQPPTPTPRPPTAPRPPDKPAAPPPAAREPDKPASGVLSGRRWRAAAGVAVAALVVLLAVFSSGPKNNSERRTKNRLTSAAPSVPVDRSAKPAAVTSLPLGEDLISSRPTVVSPSAPPPFTLTLSPAWNEAWLPPLPSLVSEPAQQSQSRTTVSSTYRIVHLPRLWPILNVRSGPGTTWGVIAVLGPKERGITLGPWRELNGDTIWQEILSGDIRGWVNARYLEPEVH